MSGLIDIEPQDARRRRGGPQRPDRRRAVPAALVVVPRVHDVAEAALQLEAHGVGVDDRGAGCPHELGRGQRRGDESAAGVSERDEAHVVVVKGVSGHAIGQGRLLRTGEQRRTQDAALAMPVSGQTPDGPRRRLDDAGKDDAGSVTKGRGGTAPAINSATRMVPVSVSTVTGSLLNNDDWSDPRATLRSRKRQSHQRARVVGVHAAGLHDDVLLSLVQVGHHPVLPRRR